MTNYGTDLSSKEGGRRILLVDDSIPFLRSFSSILQTMGYKTLTASSGTTGVEAVESFLPDVVTLDYDMPGLDGLGTLIQIRQKQPNLKVIFISANLDQTVIAQAVMNGASECIGKPVDLKRLLEVIKKLT